MGQRQSMKISATPGTRAVPVWKTPKESTVSPGTDIQVSLSTYTHNSHLQASHRGPHVPPAQGPHLEAQEDLLQGQRDREHRAAQVLFLLAQVR